MIDDVKPRRAHADPAGRSARAQTSVGADIRDLRRSRGASIADLAGEIGRSVGWVSQVERGVSAPGLADLRRIAAMFDLPISFFFRHEEAPAAERGRIVRRSARARLGAPESGLVEELLSPDLSGAFQVLQSTFSPGADSGPPQTRMTEEAGVLISGSLEVTLDGETFALGAGDSFKCAGRPLAWRNPGRAPCVVIWVVAPPTY